MGLQLQVWVACLRGGSRACGTCKEREEDYPAVAAADCSVGGNGNQWCVDGVCRRTDGGWAEMGWWWVGPMPSMLCVTPCSLARALTPSPPPGPFTLLLRVVRCASSTTPTLLNGCPVQKVPAHTYMLLPRGKYLDDSPFFFSRRLNAPVPISNRIRRCHMPLSPTWQQGGGKSRRRVK